MEVKRSMSVKDIVTAAVMMALFYAIAFTIGMGTVAVPIIYLYGTAGIEMFLGAIFYLVAANRINKHGLLFIWVMIYAIITGAMGYMFMVPYFVVVALLCELSMIGKDAYRKPIRNLIGWSIYGIGMFMGIGVPCYVAWDSYQEQALASGFADATVKLQYDMVSSPALMLVGTAVTIVLGAIGILLAQKILKKHFEKAGVLV